MTKVWFMTGLLFVTSGCGKSACEKLQELKCDCHDALCDEATDHDSNKEDEEVCEEIIQSWDCEEQKSDRNLSDDEWK